ncbi:uncharacterized protein ACO6RY_05817 [Pungitius sinensis]
MTAHFAQKVFREQMICSILVIFILTSCVCAGSFVVNVTQSWYHAEEKHNISLEWMFPTSTDHSTNSLHISCKMLTPKRPFVLFELHEGVESPEDRDERFAGRVQWDKDVLREGRLRLDISRLQTDDSGRYSCDVFTSYGNNFRKCHLNVTAVKDRPEPETTSDTSLRGDPRGRMGLYCALGLGAALLVVFVLSLHCKKCFHQQNKRSIIQGV